MSATLEAPVVTPSPVTPQAPAPFAPTAKEQRDFIAKLKQQTVACRVHHEKLGIRKALTREQMRQAAKPFDADENTLSAAKKLLDTKDPAYKAVVGARLRAGAYWKSTTTPYPEPGIRLLKRSRIPEFNAKMHEFRSELNQATIALQQKYEELKARAQEQLGSLFNAADYPAKIDDEFDMEWDFPSVEPPEHLKNLHPELYEAEIKKMEARFAEAGQLFEQAMVTKLNELVGHLVDKLAGDVDGKPKKFHDSSIENLNAFFEQFRNLDLGTSSEQLQKVVAMAQDAVKGVSPDDIRAGGDLRAKVAQQLGDVKTQMEALMVEKPKRAIRLTEEE